jgi:outer membrane murein-binding lipoprotein Lpp
LGFQLAGHLLHELHANKFSGTIHHRAIKSNQTSLKAQIDDLAAENSSLRAKADGLANEVTQLKADSAKAQELVNQQRVEAESKEKDLQQRL